MLVPNEPHSASASYLVIGGEIGRDVEESDYAMDENGRPIELLLGERLAAGIQLYDKRHDMIQEIKFSGLVGEMVRHQPSIEDRHVIDAFQIAEMLHQRRMSTGDFKKIVELALTALCEDEEKMLASDDHFFASLLSLFNLLGGPDESR